MNCNQVFNILTRGPFPSGEPTDASVEIHLATCSGCRRLAEALRPALEVFQEAVGPDECSALPGYWGELAPTSAELAVTTAPRRSHRMGSVHELVTVLAEQRNQMLLWRYGVALFATGLLMGVMLHSMFTPPHANPAPTRSSSIPSVSAVPVVSAERSK